MSLKDILGNIDNTRKIEIYNILRDKPISEILKNKSKIQKLLNEKNVNEPRKLKDKEIEDILSSLPILPCPINKIAQFENNQLKEVLKKQLREITIVEEGIPELKETIYNRYMSSLQNPGESSGINAGQAAGQTSTQANFNTFHTAGQAENIAGGLDDFRELLSVSLDRKQNLTEVHMVDKDLTKSEIMELAKDLEETSLERLLLKEPRFHRFVPKDDKWWYELYLQLTDTELPYNGSLPFKEDTEEPSKKSLEEETSSDVVFLRLHLDIKKMIRYSISMEEVVGILTLHKVICVASPLNLGIIDVYKNIYETTYDRVLGWDVVDDQKSFLLTAFRPHAKDIIIKGVKGVKSIIPATADILNFINLDERFTDSYEIKNKYENNLDLWKVSIKKELIKYMGVPKGRVAKLLTIVGAKIIDDYDNVLIVESAKPLKKLIGDMYKDEEEALQTFVSNQLKNIKNSELKFPIYREIYRFKNYNYLYLKGDSLYKRLIYNRNLDNRYIIPKNTNYIFKNFGIIATKLFLTREYFNIINSMSQGDRIANEHIRTIASFQTALGYPIPVTSTGAAKQGGSAIAAAAFQTPFDEFKKAAAVGKIDNIRGFSGSVITGNNVRNGSGIVDIVFRNKKKEVVYTNDGGEDKLMEGDLMGFHMKPGMPPLIKMDKMVLEDLFKIKKFDISL